MRKAIIHYVNKRVDELEKLNLRSVNVNNIPAGKAKRPILAVAVRENV